MVESVLDYPRPPSLQRCTERIRVVHGGVRVADSTRSIRVLETYHAPAYYLPAQDVRWDLLQVNENSSLCEFKGVASYADLVVADQPVVRDACWWYPRPARGYAAIAGFVCFYPQRVDECWVGDRRVQPLRSAFYGDWPTPDITGPVKGR